MNKQESGFSYRLMSALFRIRDFLLPRMNIVKEAGIERGHTVLDYGCGPGSYITPLAELVGKSGKIYALDIHSLAIKSVQNLVKKKLILNVVTILSDCKTGIPDNRVDVVLLYDTFHGLSNPSDVLRELHRVLKPEGNLSFNDHHMKEEEIIASISDSNQFRFSRKGEGTYDFSPIMR